MTTEQHAQCEKAFLAWKREHPKQPLAYSDLFAFLDEKFNSTPTTPKRTWPCDNTLKFTRAFCAKHNLNFTRIEKRLNETGGYCDCEVLLNSMAGYEIGAEPLV